MKNDNILCVYEFRNIQNNRHYVGSTISLKSRKQDHLKLLRKSKHHSWKLQKDFTLYGESAFVFNILEVVDDKSKLIEREQFWMDSTSPFYNVCLTAGSNAGVPVSEEQKAKIRMKLKGRVKPYAELKAQLDWISANPVTPEKRADMVRISRKFRAKSVVQLDLSGRFIREFQAICDTQEFGFDQTSVIRCCKGVLRVHKGYMFQYKDTSLGRLREPRRFVSFPQVKLRKRVVQLSLSGEFIKEFESVSSTSDFGFVPATVSDCCNGKKDSYKGYKFMFKSK